MEFQTDLPSATQSVGSSRQAPLLRQNLIRQNVINFLVHVMLDLEGVTRGNFHHIQAVISSSP